VRRNALYPLARNGRLQGEARRMLK